MAESSKYNYTDVIVWKDNYNPETKMYSWKAQTKSFWEVTFTLQKLDETRITVNGDKVVAEIRINGGDDFAIFEHERDGGKTYGGTVKKWELYLNVTPLITAGDVKNYEVTFVEVKGLPPSEIKRAEVDDVF